MAGLDLNKKTVAYPAARDGKGRLRGYCSAS